MGIFERLGITYRTPELPPQVTTADELDFSSALENDRRIQNVFGRNGAQVDLDSLRQAIEQVREREG